MAGIGFKNSSTPGRPRKQLPATALANFQPQFGSSDITSQPGYSRSKGFYRRNCGNRKHLCYAANDTISRELGTLECRICMGKGSAHEQELYSILDHDYSIGAFAVEAHVLQGTEQYSGGQLDLGVQRWDVYILQPAKVLVAVQGEQHYSKLDCRANSSSQSEADRAGTMAKDTALADAARSKGFHVVWLLPGIAAGRTARWHAAITQAINDAQLGVPPKLHVA